MDFGLFFHLDIEEKSISENKKIVSLRGIKQELYAKCFQVNDIPENLSPHIQNACRKPEMCHERLVT